MDAARTLRPEPAERARHGQGAPAPHLFLALECERPLAGPSRYCLAGVDELRLGRGPERESARSESAGACVLELRVPDPWMSKQHAEVRRAAPHWLLEDLRSTNGSLVNGTLRERILLADGDLIQLGRTLFLFREGVPVPDGGEDLDAGRITPAAEGLLTLLPALATEFKKLARVARSNVEIVVLGESGTGKEVIARAIHRLSGRPGPYVAMNCAALPEALIETELFGCRKGAFSGASEDRPGLVRSADRGTLFLDEIGDLHPSAQAALLRVLQEREVLPVGATRPAKVDLRLVAATQVDLERLVAAGSFRADLFARVSGFVFALPPLRERREDIGLLVANLLGRLEPERASRIRLSPEAASALFRYSWPLNIRELEKCLARATALAGDGVLELAHLPPAISQAPAKDASPSAAASRTAAAVAPPSEKDRERRDRLIALLREHEGNITAVARTLGKARTQVQRWIKRFGLEPRSFRR